MPLMQHSCGIQGVRLVCRELGIARRYINGINNASGILKNAVSEKSMMLKISQEIKRVYKENYSVYCARKVFISHSTKVLAVYC